MDIKASNKGILLKADINNILFKVIVMLLASATLTFAVTFGILFSVVLFYQMIQGLPETVVEIEPLSLLLIPTAMAILVLGLRIALLRRYSNIRLQA